MTLPWQRLVSYTWNRFVGLTKAILTKPGITPAVSHATLTHPIQNPQEAKTRAFVLKAHAHASGISIGVCYRVTLEWFTLTKLNSGNSCRPIDSIIIRQAIQLGPTRMVTFERIFNERYPRLEIPVNEHPRRNITRDAIARIGLTLIRTTQYIIWIETPHDAASSLAYVF